MLQIPQASRGYSFPYTQRKSRSELGGTRMYLEQRSRSFASGDSGLSAQRLGQHWALRPTFTHPPQGAGACGDAGRYRSRVGCFICLTFQTKAGHPILSPIICPKHIKTPEIEQEEGKATFHLPHTSLTEYKQTEAVWER